MKKLQQPRVRDIDIIRGLSNNEELHKTSYPSLKQQLNLIEGAYSAYSLHQGNAWSIASPVLTQVLKTALIKHYNSPPNLIDFLTKLRKSSPESCPMCGGFKPSTLDHVLPKEDYPAWAIYSKNLVPACGCNMARGCALKGNNATQARVLHPYYDNCLNERLLTTTFNYPDDFRWIKAKLDYVNINHPEIASIKYHTVNIVLKNDIDTWLRGQVSKLKEFPANVIKTIPRRRAINQEQLIDALQDCLESYDEQCGSPNNWNSILMHGLLNSAGIHGWIIATHNEAIANR